ncbi:HD-GYP domain-containing protein, partial [Candidatus Woesearchaeota archaeon]|nr:HD-GYP domain-containing protein [Candidatus Woesearchaeota archaeon]
RTLEMHRQESALAAEIAVKQELSDEAIQLITGSIEANDKYTKGHSVRVAHYGLQIFKYLDPQIRQDILNKDPDFEDNFDNACKVHDMGKIGIPSRILKKPGKLTAEEYAFVKKHPMIMYNLLSKLKNWERAANYAVGHHEKYDGTGYPHGLRGREIPISSRIMAVGDVFDALTSQRAYRDPWSIEKTITIIQKDTGSHFDRNIVDAFLTIPMDVVKGIMAMENYDQDASTQPHSGKIEKRTD